MSHAYTNQKCTYIGAPLHARGVRVEAHSSVRTRVYVQYMLVANEYDIVHTHAHTDKCRYVSTVRV